MNVTISTFLIIRLVCPQNLHNLCFPFPLGIIVVPRETEDNAYANFWGAIIDLIFSTLPSETNFNFPAPPFNHIAGIYKKNTWPAWGWSEPCRLDVTISARYDWYVARQSTSFQYVIGSSGPLEISCACRVLSVLTRRKPVRRLFRTALYF